MSLKDNSVKPDWEKIEVQKNQRSPRTMGEAMIMFNDRLEYLDRWNDFEDVVQYHSWVMNKQLKALLSSSISMKDFLELFDG